MAAKVLDSEAGVPDLLVALEQRFAQVDGYGIAREERSKLRRAGRYAETESLQYGEVRLTSFWRLLQTLPLTPEHRIFADVGSGTGKPVFCAAALEPAFDTCIGIEIVPALHEEACRVQAALQQGTPQEHTLAKRIQLHNADLFKAVDVWAQAQVLYIPCTCFTNDMMAAVHRLLLEDKVAPGTLIITTTRELTDKEGGRLAHVLTRQLPYQRGAITFHVYRKLQGSSANSSTTTSTSEAAPSSPMPGATTCTPTAESARAGNTKSHGAGESDARPMDKRSKR